MIEMTAPTPHPGIYSVPACDAVDFGLACTGTATWLATTFCCNEKARCCDTHRAVILQQRRRDVVCGVCHTAGRLGQLVRFELITGPIAA